MVHLHDILKLLISCAIGDREATVIFLSNHLKGNVIVCGGNHHGMLVLSACMVVLHMHLVLIRVLVQLWQCVTLAKAFAISSTAILQL